MHLTRPLNFIDCETTGLDLARDRILELAIVQWRPDSSERTYCWKFNPGINIPAQVVSLHGLSQEHLRDCPTFAEKAAEVLGVLNGCDLAGFNLINFDVPMLWEEFYRVGIDWDIAGTGIIDASAIFRKRESRSLSYALKFYCNRAHPKAHSAVGDVHACIDVLSAQLKIYREFAGKDVQTIARECQDHRLDLAGYIVQDRHGECCYGLGFDHGDRTGRRVKDDPWLGEWMLSRAFPEHTKRVLKKLLDSRRLYKRRGPPNVSPFLNARK